MRRSHVSQDILDAIKACLPVEFCSVFNYQFFRSRGLPPAECDSITASWVDATTTTFGDCEDINSCGEWDKINNFRIVLTRVCMGPDGGATLDWQAEDTEAACFDDHLDLLEECVLCMDWQPIKDTHSLVALKYLGVNYDIETEGGGFSAYLEFKITAAECCTVTP